jgi:hypothetical protein
VKFLAENNQQVRVLDFEEQRRYLPESVSHSGMSPL